MPSAKRAARTDRRSYLVVASLAFTLTAVAAPARAQEATGAEPVAALEPAARAYAELRLDDAWAEIERVIAAFEAAPGSIPRETRVGAYVLGASIARARGDLAASDTALDGALALDPSLALDPALHPPPLLEALERRRAALTARLDAARLDAARLDAARLDAARLEATDTTAPDEGEPTGSDAARVVVGPPAVGPTVNDRGDDPWPWVGLGVGGAVLLGGVIVLTVVLAQPPASFEVRGTIVP